MHGMINRSIQGFLRDTYGDPSWKAIAVHAQLGLDNFEPLSIYGDALTEAMIDAAAKTLARPRETVLEDIGTYLVSHPNLEPLRRLLRFGGVTFVEFLHSMEDLPEHAHLGLPDLEVPEFFLVDCSNGQFLLQVSPLFQGIGHVVVGLLRAMADDYGALVLLDHKGVKGGREVISILLLDQSYSAGRRFELVMPPEGKT